VKPVNRKGFIWRGRKESLRPLWSAATKTIDARVDQDGVLTLTHLDGTVSRAVKGKMISIRDGRLVVSKVTVSLESDEEV